MENMTTKITSSYNNALDIKVVDGHFATNHSHINRYIDMTTIKSRRKMALAAAKSMATEYVATTIVDTIVCMDGGYRCLPCKCPHRERYRVHEPAPDHIHHDT